MENKEYDITPHAVKRAAQRGISEKMMSLALKHGDVIHRQGLQFYISNEKELKGILSSAEIDKYKNVVVVVSKCNKIITCYKNRDARKHISKKSKDLIPMRINEKQFIRKRIKQQTTKPIQKNQTKIKQLKQTIMETTNQNRKPAAVYAVVNNNYKLSVKIEECISHLSKGLYEREEAIRLALLALLGGEHIFMLGAPGVAKSLLANRLTKVVKDANLFSYLMTRYTQPEEIFGPIMLSKLKQDIFEKKTDGYLPKAEVAFLDEIWKSNSSILNTLLTILNERKFFNASNNPDVPLHTMFCASNELPAANQSLEALYDRLLVRIEVKGISSAENKIKLLSEPTSKEWVMRHDLSFSSAELKNIFQQSKQVELPNEIAKLLVMLAEELAHGDANQKSITVSDRRLTKIVHLLKVSAFVSGRKKVNVNDCALMPYCLWNKPEELNYIKDKMHWLIKERLFAAPSKINQFNNNCNEFIKVMQRENKENIENKMIREQYHNLQKLINQEMQEARQSETERKIQNGVSVFFSENIAVLGDRDLINYRHLLAQLRDNLEAAFNEFNESTININKAA
jgi:MoxR-like ATPase